MVYYILQLPLGQAQRLVHSYTGWNGGFRFSNWLVECSLSQLQRLGMINGASASVIMSE
ncbi:hypothetical protein PilKf_01585 [Pillotina sp. SPG140]|jgi:hypothetical protein